MRLELPVFERQKMAIKQKPNEKLVAAFAETKPAKPALSAADKTYLRGLRRQGYTNDEIKAVAAKAGFDIPPDLFISKKPARAQPVEA